MSIGEDLCRLEHTGTRQRKRHPVAGREYFHVYILICLLIQKQSEIDGWEDFSKILREWLPLIGTPKPAQCIPQNKVRITAHDCPQ